jgi:hypothetical protein
VKACPVCHCATQHVKRRARVSACLLPLTCWKWDHDCYAKRMRSAVRRSTPMTPYVPATIGGIVIPNTTISGIRP